MRKLTLVILSAGSLSLPACNTTIGVARDIRSFGEGVENVAQGRNFDGNQRTNSTLPPPESSSNSSPGSPLPRR